MQPTEVEPPIAAAVVTEGYSVLLVRRRHGEGTLLWQFPAGAVADGETPEAAAVRETSEEVGLAVRAIQRLGERVHPATGRTMVYVSCQVLGGDLYVADREELDATTWSELKDLEEYIPHGLYQPVRDYLDRALVG